jgi:hypothetical protein
LKWDRSTSKIRLYIDARGELDLRHPMGSSIMITLYNELPSLPQIEWLEVDERPVRLERLEVDERPVRPFEPALIFQPMEWVEALHEPGHYKGYLTFQENMCYQPGGLFFFSYANTVHATADYESVSIAKVRTSLKESMDSYSLDES